MSIAAQQRERTLQAVIPNCPEYHVGRMGKERRPDCRGLAGIAGVAAVFQIVAMNRLPSFDNRRVGRMPARDHKERCVDSRRFSSPQPKFQGMACMLGTACTPDEQRFRSVMNRLRVRGICSALCEF